MAAESLCGKDCLHYASWTIIPEFRKNVNWKNRFFLRKTCKKLPETISFPAAFPLNI